MAKSLNNNLHKAKKGKNDEFYTQLSDIENELKHYAHHFKGKVVYCNCDDPRISNFFHYFSYNFEKLGLKKLITTCYKNQNKDLFSQNDSEQAIYLEYTGDKNGDNIPNPEEIGIHFLQGDGDFRSAESIELLKQADIVVTNPPFSLFREFVAQLIEYDKKFLIIGNMNAITYKEIFPLIAQNKIWLGPSISSGDREFGVPENYPLNAAGWRIDENGRKYIRVKGVRWFTNLDHNKRHEELILYKTYQGNEQDYPKYDNYNAINVDKVADIPMDYEGVMGVPITFLDKYNPKQFEIVAFRKGDDGKDLVYSLSRNEQNRTEQNRTEQNAAASSTLLPNTHLQNLEINSLEMTEQQFLENLSMQEFLSDRLTSVAGMIKNAEGKINGKITYARITIRRIS